VARCTCYKPLHRQPQLPRVELSRYSAESTPIFSSFLAGRPAWDADRFNKLAQLVPVRWAFFSGCKQAFIRDHQASAATFTLVHSLCAVCAQVDHTGEVEYAHIPLRAAIF